MGDQGISFNELQRNTVMNVMEYLYTIIGKNITDDETKINFVKGFMVNIVLNLILQNTNTKLDNAILDNLDDYIKTLRQTFNLVIDGKEKQNAAN